MEPSAGKVEMSESRPRVPHRGLTTVLTLGVPLLILVGSLLWARSFWGDLPDPVATHWGFDGHPDGFDAAGSMLWLLAIMVPVFSLAMWVLGFQLGSSAVARRIAAAFGVWFGVFLCGVIVGSLAIQRGLADAARATGIGPVIWTTLAAATVLAVVAAVLTPGDRLVPATAAVPARAVRLPARDARMAAWTRTAAIPHLRTVGIIGGLVTALVAVAAMMFPSSRPITWTVAGVVAFVTLLVLVTGHWTVTVDSAGLTAYVVHPRLHTRVPLAEVEWAERADVRPFADFGGWGYRIDSTGRVGVVVRSGDAILVHRTAGRTFVVTVDDAATGTALLNTLAERARVR